MPINRRTGSSFAIASASILIDQIENKNFVRCAYFSASITNEQLYQSSSQQLTTGIWNHSARLFLANTCLDAWEPDSPTFSPQQAWLRQRLDWKSANSPRCMVWSNLIRSQLTEIGACTYFPSLVWCMYLNTPADPYNNAMWWPRMLGWQGN